MREPDLVEPITHNIVNSVAKTKGISPKELEPLANVIDPDALEALFGSPSDQRREFRFEYEGCTVFVTSSEVRVREQLGTGPRASTARQLE
ncbi:HalOD1 output domain-containing protein [Halapricum desulfuricans]|uniref:HalOD1 output domain-containing protein n=1 Tax=Halapricum desulfuricans TaxID=2841257 RepID=UPI003744472D